MKKKKNEIKTEAKKYDDVDESPISSNTSFSSDQPFGTHTHTTTTV